MTNNYNEKHKEKLQKNYMKDIKIFLNKKKTKGKIGLRKISKFY